MTVAKALQLATEELTHAGLNTPRLDAEVILGNIMNVSRLELLVHNDDEINKAAQKLFKAQIARRAKLEPVSYLTNRKSFYKLDFFVDQRVLTPRPETEIAVEAALDIIENVLTKKGEMNYLDMGTGSGCIPISILYHLPNGLDKRLKITASDISKDALEVARVNARNFAMISKIKLLQSDLFKRMDTKNKFDLITANLPYVPRNRKQLTPEEKSIDYEPDVALYGGETGLDVYLNFFKQVGKFLTPKGQVIVEIDNGQAEAIHQMVKEFLPSKTIKVIRDMAGYRRTVVIY